MKKKGITIWEQHLEHIVLGASVVFLLGFGGWQLTRSPNTVGGVAPGDADAVLDAAVQSLNAKLDGASIDLPEYDPAADDFAARLGGSVSPSARMLVAAPAVDLGDGAQGEGGGERLYVTLDLPAPDRVVVQTDYDALDPAAVSDIPELAELLDDSPGYDIEWNTIAARVDLAGLDAQFRQTGSDERAAIPENWYGGRISILDVRIERQVRDGAGWGDTELVGTIPGVRSLRAEVAEGTESARELVTTMLEDPAVRREIVQPEFLPTRNETWSAPDPLAADVAGFDAAGLSGEELEVQRLLDRLMRDRRELQRLLDRIIAMGGGDPREQSDRRERDGQRSGGGSGGDGGGDESAPGRERQDERRSEREGRRAAPGGGGGGGFGAGGGDEGGGRNQGSGQRGAPGSGIGQGGFGAGGEEDNSAERREAERRQRTLERMSQAVEQLERRISRTEQQLRDLGVVLDRQQVQEQSGGDPLAGEELAVWGFDIDVEPGRTYRYRVTVDLYNPFFRRRIDLSESQFDLADSMAVATRTSDWSDPVQVLPPTSFFVTEATADDGRLGMGSLKAEVFRFQEGRWWKETFSIEPGEPIGAERRVRSSLPGVPEEIDYGTGWFVLDVVRSLTAGDAERQAGFGAEVIVQRMDGAGEVRLERPGASRADRRRLDLDRMVSEAEDAARMEAARGE
jgi:hypothetical protein